MAPTKATPLKPAATNRLIACAVIGVLGLIAYNAWRLVTAIPQEPAAPLAAEVPAAPGQGQSPIVVIETDLGTIRARLYSERAPATVENFVDLVKRKFYDGIIFHRVIPGFMIQTGDPLGQGTGGRTDKGLAPKKLDDEFHPALRHDRPGILSMANAGPNTGDTQFFITTVPTQHLDDKHAIFGEVIEGLDVVRAIEQQPTDDRDKPNHEIRMKTVRLESSEPGGIVRVALALCPFGEGTLRESKGVLVRVAHNHHIRDGVFLR